MNILLLCLTALTLGLRHGLDFDHIAALLDMAGTSATDGSVTASSRFRRALQAIKLPALYVCGHGLMIIVLGVTALAFGAVIPQWVDVLMQRTVGVTLLLLSVYLFYSLLMFLTKGQDLQLRSRWMVLFAAVAHAWDWLKSKVSVHHTHTHKHAQINWDAKGAFLVGLIHGFGAETGTQVLLFASVVGTGSMLVAGGMLMSFTLGMAISTLAIAVGVSAGLTHSVYYKPAMFILGVLAALFSFVVGVYFTFGLGGLLPSL